MPPPLPTTVWSHPPVTAQLSRPSSSNAGLVVAALVVGSISVFATGLSGQLRDEASAYTLGIAIASLLWPTIIGLLFKRRSRTAGLIAFIVVAALMARPAVAEVLEIGIGPSDDSRAIAVLSRQGSEILDTDAGRCLRTRMAGFDDATLDELERIEQAPGPSALEQLREAVDMCGASEAFVKGHVDAMVADGFDTDAFDQACMAESIDDPGSLLFHTTLNQSLLELSASVPADDVFAVATSTWSWCIDGGAMVADVVAANGGPSFGSASVACLDDWFRDGDRITRFMIGNIPELGDGLFGCLDDADLDAYDSWTTTTI